MNVLCKWNTVRYRIATWFELYYFKRWLETNSEKHYGKYWRWMTIANDIWIKTHVI